MTRVAIAAPHGLAVDAARDAIAAGGNALDAALAAAAILVVVYPHQCALGGDLSALVRMPGGAVEVVLSLGAASAGTDVARLRAAGQGMPRQGPDAVTVPGVVAGWIALAELGARLGLAPALRRAAARAETGAPVSPGLTRAIEERREAIEADPGLRALLLPDGDPVTRDFLQPALAGTLGELADDPKGFYRGAVAARLAAGLARLGSAITEDDLASHEVDRPEPLMLETDGARWWAAAPPSQGATALALLDPAIPGDLLARARSAHAARARLLGDPRGGEIDIDGLRRPENTADAMLTGASATGDTVAVTAVDDEGRSVSLIQSVFQSFGAGLLEPGTGIVLHNRGAAFVVLDEAAHEAHPARLAPGLRPPHTLCPLLAESPVSRVALGCQGGRAQPLILAQVGRATLDPRQPLKRTLAAPRWVVGDRDLGYDRETVLAEPGAAVPSADRLPLEWTAGGDDRCGHVQAARVVAGDLQAAADPRADGRACEAHTSSSGRST